MPRPSTFSASPSTLPVSPNPSSTRAAYAATAARSRSRSHDQAASATAITATAGQIKLAQRGVSPRRICRTSVSTNATIPTTAEIVEITAISIGGPLYAHEDASATQRR